MLIWIQYNLGWDNSIESSQLSLRDNKRHYVNNQKTQATDNTNLESRSLSVVKYVINNIMSTALTGQIKTATYLHLMR